MEDGAAANSLVVPRSKTDQAGQGERIPMTRHIPVIGDIRPVLIQLQEMQMAHGASSQADTVLTMYSAQTHSMTLAPMAKTSVTSRLRLLLARHLGMDDKRLKKFASHTMRRGGATYYATLGVPDATIQRLGRWSSHAFELYTETTLSVINANIADLMGTG